MAKQPYISHVVNGYSRYDLPESVAFTCTPGILYPVRMDFINARDRVTIDQGIDVRSNPLAVPTFNPYSVRLHRFWVPLQLYHPELRTNSSAFDMNNLSLNWIPYGGASSTSNVILGDLSAPAPNSLMSWLRLAGQRLPVLPAGYFGVTLPSSALVSDVSTWWNGDTYLAYWDIVRNFYCYSQWKVFSFAWPGGFYQYFQNLIDAYKLVYSGEGSSALSVGYFTQRYGNLEFLDAYFESQFYPGSLESANGTYNRSNLLAQIVASDLGVTGQGSSLGAQGDGYPVTTAYAGVLGGDFPADQAGTVPVSISTSGSGSAGAARLFAFGHPMAVVPSSPDRYSRLLPPGSSNSAVSMSGVSTIPQLAVAARLQEYKDLLGAGGSRYSDWLETFFASKIEHVDRPKLLFSASQTVNVQVVLNQAGSNNFSASSQPLGAQGGAIAFNSKLGRSQSYYFREPGYMIDMFSIRPVYYWSGIVPDYMKYQGADYFNPVYNDIGYQDVSAARVGTSASSSGVFAQEPCFNEFRASYDTVLGEFVAGTIPYAAKPLYSYWVQQRSAEFAYTSAAYSMLFVDMSTVNSPFASNLEDNFFVNLSYSVRKKNLVNKTFATRLANR